MKLRGRLLLILAVPFFLGGSNAPRPILLAFLGDIMLGRGVAEAHANGGWQEAFSAIVPELSGVDFSLANLESPICENDQAKVNGQDKGGYILTAPEAGLEALRALRLGIVSLANNHSLDCGVTGLETTAAILGKMGVYPLIDRGQTIFVDTRQGRYAFMGFDDVGNGMDLHKASQAVSKARGTGATVIVSLHWGLEYQPGANVRQRSQAQALADAGAALIWGHHPHVLQPPAWVQGKGQSRPTLVLYSLGNALFDQHAPPDAMRSAMVFVAFDNDTVVRMEIFPFVIDPRRGRIISASPAEIYLIYRRMKVDKPQISKEEIWWVKFPTAER